MIYALSGIGGLLMIFGILRVSLLFTERKSNEDLKRRLPDASDIHRDGGALS